jgi:hypothetical protein
MIWLPNSIVYHHSFLLRDLIDLFDIDHRNINIFFVIEVLIFAIFCWRNYLFYGLNTFITILSLVTTVLSLSLWGIFLNMNLRFDKLRLKVYSHIIAIIFPKWIKIIQPICPYFSYYKWKIVWILWNSCAKSTYINKIVNHLLFPFLFLVLR